MTVKGRFTLDTNILIYAIDLDAGHKHDYRKSWSFRHLFVIAF